MNSNLQLFAHLLLYFIDKGHKEDLKTIEDEFYNKNVVNYIIKKYQAIDNVPLFDSINPDVIQEHLNELDCSETGMHDLGFDNNGLLFIVQLILDKISSDCFDLENTIN